MDNLNIDEDNLRDVQHNKHNDAVDLLKLCATFRTYCCQKDAIPSDWVKIPDKSILRGMLQDNLLVGSFAKILGHVKQRKAVNCHSFDGKQYRNLEQTKCTEGK